MEFGVEPRSTSYTKTKMIKNDFPMTTIASPVPEADVLPTYDFFNFQKALHGGLECKGLLCQEDTLKHRHYQVSVLIKY